MKTGMEILKEILRLAVVEGQKAYSGPGGYSSGQASGLRVSGDLLQAWLGEADKRVVNYIGYRQAEYFRERILGTTQEGK
ncbi:hypothetical protein LCGC14_0466970 [marine sediment metagenome]|uniref:Uncharacterized protein n=1 Tax=marine sediment metagenome TaxID=412755 RepID=A0A0F9SWE9_9ZZZZ